MIERHAASGMRERILAGTDPELRRLAAQGLVPLPPSELVELQVQLAQGGDAETAGLALDSLRQMEPRILAATLEDEMADEVVRFLGTNLDHPTVLEAVIRKADVPRDLLVDLARRVPPALQEIVILRQDAILEHPEILEALEANPEPSPHAARKIREYRQHLLEPGQALPGPALPEATPPEAASLESVSTEPAAEQIEEEEFEAVRGLTEGQIRTLSPPERLRLARGATREVRTILVRDPNPLVALEVVRKNTLGESEVENICQNRMICEEVLTEIANDRNWVRRYGVVRALTRNPRTPVPVALKLVPRLAARDLKALGRDRNVADAVRKTAQRTFAARHG